MIKLEYRPWTPDSGVAELFDPPVVEIVTMTLGDDLSWDEAVCEFKNFLRAAGYVIPYDFENDSNTGVASEDESNTDVAEKREWVGLTTYELQDLTTKSYVTYNTGETHFNRGHFADAIEAKLKEKNT